MCGGAPLLLLFVCFVDLRVWTTQHDCPRTNTSATFVQATVDYHQESLLFGDGGGE